MVTKSHPLARSEEGVTLVEVLVTMVILAIGLLGLVALQARVQVLQAEAYQRAQALMLLKDMAGRIANNRYNAGLYASGAAAPSGLGGTGDPESCPDKGGDRHLSDLSEWCRALEGAAEDLNGTKVGAMVAGRGCIEDLGDGRYLVAVAWQGLAPISAPPANITCGLVEDEEVEDDSPCAGDLCRRVVTTIVRIPTLT